MACVVFGLIVSGDSSHLNLALIFFVLACLTDFFDGWLARKRGEVTPLGRMIDPFADKFLIIGCFLFLFERSLSQNLDSGLSALTVFLILSREFFVNSLRAYAESQGLAFPATWLGKFKAVWQFFTIGFLILFMAHSDDFEQKIEIFSSLSLSHLSYFLIWSTVLVTWLSAFPYFFRAYRELK